MPKFQSGSEPRSTTAMTIYLPASVEFLPDKAGWTNRFHVRSESSGNKYVVSQNITHRHWGCSCRGWIIHRKCKHLENIGLPCFEKPFEAKLVKG